MTEPSVLSEKRVCQVEGEKKKNPKKYQYFEYRNEILTQSSQEM